MCLNFLSYKMQQQLRKAQSASVKFPDSKSIF